MDKANIKTMYLGAAAVFIICTIVVVLLGSGYIADDKRPKCIYRSDYEIDATIASDQSIEWYKAEGISYFPTVGDHVKIIYVSADRTCTIIDNVGKRPSTFATNVPVASLMVSVSDVDDAIAAGGDHAVTIQLGTSIIASLFIALSAANLIAFFAVNIPTFAAMYSPWGSSGLNRRFRQGFVVNTSLVVVCVIQILWTIIA